MAERPAGRAGPRNRLSQTGPAEYRAATNLENLEKSRNLTVVREKSGKVEKVWENVFCLWCVTVIAMVTEKARVLLSAVDVSVDGLQKK